MGASGFIKNTDRPLNVCVRCYFCSGEIRLGAQMSVDVHKDCWKGHKEKPPMRDGKQVIPISIEWSNYEAR